MLGPCSKDLAAFIFSIIFRLQLLDSALCINSLFASFADCSHHCVSINKMFVYYVASMHESLWYSISHENEMSQYHYTFGMMDPCRHSYTNKGKF